MQNFSAIAKRLEADPWTDLGYHDSMETWGEILEISKTRENVFFPKPVRTEASKWSDNLVHRPRPLVLASKYLEGWKMINHWASAASTVTSKSTITDPRSAGIVENFYTSIICAYVAQLIEKLSVAWKVRGSFPRSTKIFSFRL